MDNNENNNFTINQQKDIYLMIKEINNKYNLLEKKQEENFQINKDNILRLNKNLNILSQNFDNLLKQYKCDIKDLKKSILKNIDQKTDENNKIFINKLNNFENKYNKINEEMNKKFEEINEEIRKINFNMVNDRKYELKINKNTEQNIFEKFEALLSEIMGKENIDNNDLDELKQISKKLMENSTSPAEYSTRYFKDNYKYLIENNQNQSEKEQLTLKISNIKGRILTTILDIEHELELLKNKNDIKPKTTIKKTNKKVEKFRQEFKITELDADDKTIENYLNVYRDNKNKVYEVLMKKIAK